MAHIIIISIFKGDGTAVAGVAMAISLFMPIFIMIIVTP